ncbi:hypothetical protein GYB57_04205 [bacterium]|nr:hypothetical protein [bacterium]
MSTKPITLEKYNQWTDKDNLSSLLFFAQRLYEMLFDYTLDSFKAPALNTPLLCEELLVTVNHVEKDNIDRNNISAILDELKWSFSKDIVAKSMLNQREDQYLEELDLNNLKEFRLKIELLHNKLSPLKYIQSCKLHLTELIENNGSKKNIDAISRQFLSSLIDIGYHQTHLYFLTKNFFFGTETISEPSQIKDFFKLLDLEPTIYEVTLFGSPLFEVAKESCEGFDIIISNNIDLSSYWSKSLEFLETKREKQVYISVKNIRALDAYSAKQIAEYRIDKVANLLAFYHHKRKMSWSNKSVVSYDKDGKKVSHLVSKSTPPILKGNDNKSDLANEKLQLILSRLTALRGNSFAKFNTVIDLHGIALTNKDIENQLLNLWIAIETLIPTEVNKTKISSILNSLNPFLEYNYLFKIIHSIKKQLLRWNKESFENEMKKIDSESPLDTKTFIRFLCCKEYQNNRDEMYRLLGKEEMLRFRVFTYANHFSKVKNINKLILSHRQKALWHVRRIYRARNLIVHSGKNPGSIEVLVENLHSYLDLFLNQVIEFVINDLQVTTIEQAIKEVQLLNQKRENIYSENMDTQIDDSNFEALLIKYNG